MLELSGYVFSPLREGDFTLYRGTGRGLAPVLLVTAADASLACLRRLEHEYALSAELDSAWAARPVALSRYNDRLALVLEDPGGEPLDRLLGGPLNMTEFLRIAIPLAGALRQVHERGLIHKDIKPGNILLDKASVGVWLTGFGIASRLPRERQNPDVPEVIAGTLAYMAPEQTGRMNRSIDSRSDLYALGITFYEMLTGTLPFTATDPMGWVHCHIARQPTPLSERATVPGTVSAIVMKLLAKTAEDRYQTAAGVEADLRRCLAEWASHGRIEPFAVGAHDTSDRLMIPERLYGREREIDTLLGAFRRVVERGAPELTLVSGYSGIGKSSVVNELHKVLVPPRGLFASGKFDQYQRDIPYATLAEAFRSLLRPLLGQSEDQLDRWREALSDALGRNGQLIVNLVPELELVIGTQPPVPELPGQETKNRFQLVFRRFLSVFARKEHPLVLFLDDLQWLDTATLELIEHLVTHPEVRHLLVVGAYRDNEVGPAHPLRRTLEAIRAADARVHEIALAPLGLDDVGRLLAAALHCEPEQALPLAQLVHEKTGGNPFFAIQFCTALAEEGMLTFDRDAACWSWDLDRIHTKGYTDNVADLMVGKLNRLPAETQQALQLLACIGNSAEPVMLATLSRRREVEVLGQLWEAIRAGLISCSERSYSFIHDRVQEAAYSFIPENARAETHLCIGRLLVECTPPEKLPEMIFEIVNQLNRGAHLITLQDEREQLAELNLMAGKRAKASSAYASALTYLRAGATLLREDAWERRQELAFALELHSADCDLWMGALPSVEERLAALATRAVDTVQRAAVASRRVDLYTMLGAPDRAVAVGLEYLRYVGIDWAAHPTRQEARCEYERIWSQLGSRPIEDLIDLPLMEDPESRATLDVLTTLGPPTLFTDENLYALTTCRAVNLSLERGNSDAAPAHYAAVGLMAGDRFGHYDEGYRLGKMACDLTERRGLRRLAGKTYSVFALVVPWTRPLRESIDPARRAFQLANEQGDLTFAAYAYRKISSNLLALGDPLDQVEREAEHGLEFARTVRFGFAADTISAPLALVRTLRGETAKFGSLDDDSFTESSFEARLTGHPDLAHPECFYWIRKLQARFFAGDYASAIDAAEKAERWFSTSASLSVMLVERTEYHLYAALSRAAWCEPMGPDPYAKHQEALSAHHRQLQAWAENCPQNFEDRAVLVGAEIARIEGRLPEAMDLYEQAIQSARKHGFVQNEGVAHEVAAQFYAARGFETIAHAYLRNARYCYLRWGALGKVRRLDELYPRLREESAPFAPTATIGAPFEHLDVGTVVKASQAVSGEIELGKLIETLLTIAVEHAGAQRGLLILCQGDELRIEAEATTSRGSVEVTLQQRAVTASELPEAVLHYVIRTRENVLLDDAAAPTLFSADAYMQQRAPRSVLCLPLVKQAKLVGALYLENNLTPCAFTSGCIAVLEVLATQAAISLENSRLYTDLQQSEAFLAEGQSISSTGSFSWNVASGRLYWSDETYRIFGYDRAVKPTVALGLQRVHPDDLVLVQEAIARASREMTDFDVENRLLMEDGTVKTVHVIGRAMQSSSGEPEFVGAVMDVTEQKWALAERARLEQRLRQAEKMEAVGRLAGGIAHDFNNILAGVFAYGEMVLDEAPEGSPLRRYARNVLTAASRGRELIEQILAYSRSQRGKRAPVDVALVVAETLELIRGSLPANIRLESNAPDLPLVVIGDAIQLHQIVMNLCSNAIQAMRTGGTLRVALEAAEFSDEQALSHGTLDRGRYVRLIVEDSGCGMDEATPARIFEPFFTTKEIGQGTGLGLSLVYAIVTDSGGAIDVKSAPQQGSTFTIYLRG